MFCGLCVNINNYNISSFNDLDILVAYKTTCSISKQKIKNGWLQVGANKRNMKHQQRHGDQKQLSCNITQLFYLSIGNMFSSQPQKGGLFLCTQGSLVLP